MVILVLEKGYTLNLYHKSVQLYVFAEDHYLFPQTTSLICSRCLRSFPGLV